MTIISSILIVLIPLSDIVYMRFMIGIPGFYKKILDVVILKIAMVSHEILVAAILDIVYKNLAPMIRPSALIILEVLPDTVYKLIYDVFRKIPLTKIVFLDISDKILVTDLLYIGQNTLLERHKNFIQATKDRLIVFISLLNRICKNLIIVHFRAF